MILVIDNYDSFTYNLVQYLGELGTEMTVRRNDAVTLDEIRALRPSHIVISPGPGTPDDGGVSLDIIRTFYATTPILGVCLGHQCIGAAFGGTVNRAGRLMHGKTSRVYHYGTDVFEALPQPARPRTAAGLPQSHRLHHRGRSDGAPSQDRAPRRCPVSPGEHSDGAREGHFEKLFGDAEVRSVEYGVRNLFDS